MTSDARWSVLTGESGLGDVEDGVLVAWSGELHDHLAGVDVLARLGADRGDHAVELGLELGVAELIAGSGRDWPWQK